LSRRRKITLIAAGVVLALAAAAFLLAGHGSYETVAGTRSYIKLVPPGAPAWSRPCWTLHHEGKRLKVKLCARLRARVLWVAHEKPEHGGDAHLITVAHRHIRFAKLSPGDARRLGVPGVGHRVTLIGPVIHGAHVDSEVWAWAVQDDGI
jgi:hypothetical protein